MSIRRSTFVMSGDSFFEPGVPIYVNRAYETFELNAHSHEFIEITYISEGAGVHYIDDEVVPVEHGTLFYIPVGRSHVFRPKTSMKTRPLIVYNCLFPVKYLSELQATFPHTTDICEFFTDMQLQWFSMKDVNGAYHIMFRELFREFSAKPPGYLAVLDALVVQILTGLFRHRLQNVAPAGAKPQWMAVDEAIAFITYNYANGLKLGDLANKANLSERQFSRLFQHQTGMNFTDYMQSIRMDAACRMLSGGQRSVSEIASAVGYADLKFFHHIFKKKIGMSPKQYSNSIRSEK
ncbi:AraC family L-rhamnose operon transcriptional activator RhaR [Paenibacillus sp. PastF-3]|uniref:AraC family transcriptional regulator n=1 Tax=Paenibacillus sp. PastF-3 TaxID=2940626 RepID=UPI002476F2F8|nr:AraC family transcriptional regulator [Paenibacillus sp. PastF-3]MDH6368841.1 AraC family L-rhamnose operon transcriptional activator RhaR [Paenibacillus sp. PastF-3]